MKRYRKIKEKRRSRDGFTLVEALFSAFIMVFVLGSSIIAVNAALRRVAAAEAKMAAMHQARTQMEVFRALPYDHPDLDVGTRTIYVHTTTDHSRAGTAKRAPTGNAVASYEVTVVAADTKRLSMDVSYLDPLGGHIRTVNLVTKVTKPLH